MDGYLLGNEKWESKLETNIPNFAWGLVTDVQEGRTVFLAILTSPEEITIDQFESLDTSVLENCAFKKADLEGSTFYLSQVGINGKLYDFVMRCPFWSNKDGTNLYTDDKVKEPVLGKGGMSLGMVLSSTAKNFISAVVKKRAVPQMILSQRSLLWFGAANSKGMSPEKIAEEKAAEKDDIVSSCRFDASGSYFVTVAANTSQTPIQHYKGMFSLVEDRDLIVSEYIACPFRLVEEVFGKEALSEEGHMKFREGQLRNAIGVADLSFRYHVGKDTKVFDPEKKIFTLKWGTRRIIVTEVLEKPHDPMIPPPMMTLADRVLSSFNCSEKTTQALVHKRELASGEDGPEHKKLCLEDKTETAAEKTD